jgi:hypothetical protein
LGSFRHLPPFAGAAIRPLASACLGFHLTSLRARKIGFIPPGACEKAGFNMPLSAPPAEHGRMNQVDLMQTTVNLPDSLYQKSEQLAASRGATVEQFIVEAVKKEVGSETSGSFGDRDINLPVIHSSRPGALDLSDFDFDDLLA